MTNLFKIKKLTRELSQQFGDTLEGAGYTMLYQMLGKEENATAPGTINTLYRELSKKLGEYGLKSYFSISVKRTRYDSRPEYEASFHLSEKNFKTVKGSSYNQFYRNCIEYIGEEAPKAGKEAAKIIQESDIALK